MGIVGPLTLDPILAAGATFFGAAVRAVRLELDDGRVMRLELPADGPSDDDGLSPTQARIVKTLTDSPVPLTQKEIARRIGRKGTGGRFNESLHSLVELPLARIFTRGGEYTDDATKFGAGG